MQGNIDFIGSLSGDISGGGGGGSDVTITPTLSSGTKIADYEIDGVGGILYAPPSTINRAQLPLLIIGDELRIDLSNYYNKQEIAIELQTYQRQMESIDSQVDISGTHSNQISLTFDIDDYQKKLTAGENITIDPDTNVISASGGSTWNYSTTPVKTGQKWIDGKDLYSVVLQVNNLAPEASSNILLNNVDSFMLTSLNVHNISDNRTYAPFLISTYNIAGVGTFYPVVMIDDTTHELYIQNQSRQNTVNTTAVILFTYYS